MVVKVAVGPMAPGKASVEAPAPARNTHGNRVLKPVLVRLRLSQHGSDLDPLSWCLSIVLMHPQ